MCTSVTGDVGAPRGTSEPPVVTLVEDADGHERTVRGAQVQSFRLGKGHGPNVTTTQAGRGFVATAVRAGFPMASRAVAAPDRVYAVAAIAAPPGSRWSGHYLDVGQLLFYGPEVHHTAVNPVGVHFSFAAIEHDALIQTADGMGVTPNLPGRGEVRAIPTAGAHALWHVLASLADPTSGLITEKGPELLRTTIETLRTDGEVAFCRRIDSGALVLACVDYAERAAARAVHRRAVRCHVRLSPQAVGRVRRALRDPPGPLLPHVGPGTSPCAASGSRPSHHDSACGRQRSGLPSRRPLRQPLLASVRGVTLADPALVELAVSQSRAGIPAATRIWLNVVRSVTQRISVSIPSTTVRNAATSISRC